MTFSIRVDSKLGLLQNHLVDQVSKITRKSAFDCQADWQRRAPVRTGAYRNSITAQDAGSGHAAAPSWVVFTGLVSPPYPFFLEFGTRKMAPRPSAGPAAQSAQASFTEAMGHVLDGV